MKLFLKGLIVGTILLAAITVAMAAQLTGTVAGVKGLDVTVKVDGQLMPAAGDQVEISFLLPDGEALPIGTWQVNMVNGNIAIASVKNNTGNPVIGHKAVIFSKNPIPLENKKKAKPQSTDTYIDNSIGISGEAKQVIEEILSSNPNTKRNAAKKAYKNYLNNSQVVAVAAKELQKGYKINLKNKQHIDAMAWFCKILGSSHDVKYAPLLRKVYTESRVKKIKKYAKINYKRLR